MLSQNLVKVRQNCHRHDNYHRKPTKLLTRWHNDKNTRGTYLSASCTVTLFKLYCVSLKFGQPGDTTRATERQTRRRGGLVCNVSKCLSVCKSGFKYITDHSPACSAKEEPAELIKKKKQQNYAPKPPQAFPTCTRDLLLLDQLIRIACGRCRRHTKVLWLRSVLFSCLDPLKMGPMGCPETSVRNYNYTLRNIPGECRSHLLCVGSLKSFIVGWLVTTLYQVQR